jgi:hypothetical protein
MSEYDRLVMVQQFQIAAAVEALNWIAENYPKVMREMPAEIFQRLRLANREQA